MEWRFYTGRGLELPGIVVADPRYHAGMVPRNAALIAAVVTAFAAAPARQHAAADTTNLAGVWSFNPSLSRIPEDIGFGMDMLRTTTDPSGRGDPSGTSQTVLFRESADDAARREHLVNEVRRPPEELRITQTETTIVIVGDRGQPRTFSLDGRESMQKVGLISAAASARWNGPRLDVRYKVEENREVHLEYSRTTDPDRLTIDVRFVERGGHDSAVLVYEPAREGVRPAAPAPGPRGSGTATAGAQPPAAAAPPPTLGGLGQAARGGGLGQAPPARPTLPTLTPPAPQEPAPGPAGPDAPLAGLARIGMVVEDLRPQAAACGLSQAPLEAIVAKAFTDAGIKVVKDSDEDTYVYVDIGTSSVSAGLCVSRWDVSLISNTMARLSHQSAPVLVQVQLLHQGGLSGGAPAAHGDAVRKNVKQAVDDFASRIRSAGK
jgi:hypothetical protein